MRRDTTPKVLIVEDDPENRAAMIHVLEVVAYRTMETDNGEQALDWILKQKVDIVISDLRLPGMDGVELLKRAKTLSPDIEVILVTGYGTIDIAVEALKEGAYDFITKPIKKAYLLRCVERAAEKQHLARENRALRSQLHGNRPRVIHANSEMRNIVQMVEQVGAECSHRSDHGRERYW